MSAKSIQNTLKNAFPKADREGWRIAAAAETNDADPIKSLQWGIDRDLLFLPIYDKIDANELQYLQKFIIQPTANSYAEPRGWNNLPNITVTNEKAANQLALEYLATGADGVLFTVENASIDLIQLFEKIEWSYCFVSLALTPLALPALTQLKKIIAQKKYDPAVVSGILFWKAVPDAADELVHQFAEEKKIAPLGLRIEPSDPVQEISECLVRAVRLIDMLSKKNLDEKTIIKNIAFSVSANTNFFITVATLKALRILWYQVAQAYTVTDYLFSDLHIHVRSEASSDKRYEPHGNMLKSTLASMAAVCGGCDSLTVYVDDDHDRKANRIGRNVSSILREESHLGKVSDPAAGAYAIDAITHQIAQKAWHAFSSQLNAGA